MDSPGEDHSGAKLDPEILELIPNYLEMRRADLQALKKALSDGDFETIVKVSHRITGSGGGYGFESLTEIARSVQTAGGEKDEGAVRAGLERLEEYLDEVRVKFDSGK